MRSTRPGYEYSNSKFDRWLVKMGGLYPAGKAIGVHFTTVSRWKNKNRYPQGHQIQLILAAARGALTAQDIYDHFKASLL